MRQLRFAILVAIVAVTAHDATYVLGHGVEGYSGALRGSGHGGHWQAVAFGVGATLIGALLTAGGRWLVLRRRLASHGAGPRLYRMPSIGPAALRLTARLFVLSLALFVVQENLEAVAAGSAPPGLSVLVAPNLAAAVPAFAVVATVFAVLTGLIGARILELERALASVAARLPRAALRLALRPGRGGRLGLRSRSSTPDLGRAPPVSVVV